MLTVYSHSDSARHVTPPGHAESPARFNVVEGGIAALDLPHKNSPLGQEADILRCHPEEYIDQIRSALPEHGLAALDADTFLSPGSLDAALRGVGGICAAVDEVLSAQQGTAQRAFVTARPPGHHAERTRAMGFCLFGTAAIGAMRALDHHALSRVAVLDFDVHHGNGTQDILWDEPRVRFISSHQMPLYPGTGTPDERGAHNQITNLPLSAGSGGAQMRAAWAPHFAQLRAFNPELIIVSAGFDAHRADPLAGLNWETDDFAWITAQICALADECCGGRIVSTLEGGYDLEALGACVTAHLHELGRMNT